MNVTCDWLDGSGRVRYTVNDFRNSSVDASIIPGTHWLFTKLVKKIRAQNVALFIRDLSLNFHL